MFCILARLTRVLYCSGEKTTLTRLASEGLFTVELSIGCKAASGGRAICAIKSPHVFTHYLRIVYVEHAHVKLFCRSFPRSLFPEVPPDFRVRVRGIRLSSLGQVRSPIPQTCRADDPLPRAPSASAVAAKAPAGQAGANPIRSSTLALPTIAPARPASSYRKIDAAPARKSGCPSASAARV